MQHQHWLRDNSISKPGGNLGVLLDTQLYFQSHISNIVKVCRFTLEEHGSFGDI